MIITLLNGWNYPLDRWLKPLEKAVGLPMLCHPEKVWTAKKAHAYAERISEPTILIGFSRGANAALIAAQHSEFIEYVYAHSVTVPEPLTIHFRRKFPVRFFRTAGDWTPTFKGTLDVFDSYVDRGYRTSLTTLQPKMFLPHSIMETVLFCISHQFHNIISELEC